MQTHRYNPGYIDALFYQWYSAGKPSISKFYPTIESQDDIVGKPSKVTVQNWRKDDWNERALELDEQVKGELKAAQVSEQVAMMKRHGDTGRTMQELALNWLMENKDNLTPGTAVRMLVDGIEIERGTAGIPEALEKLIKKTDEDILDEIQELVADSPIDANN